MSACDGSRAVGYFWSAALGWPLVWDQDGETAIRAYRDAWRDAGWTFVTDTTGRVAADHSGVRSTIYLDGDQPLLRIEVRDRT